MPGKMLNLIGNIGQEYIYKNSFKFPTIFLFILWIKISPQMIRFPRIEVPQFPIFPAGMGNVKVHIFCLQFFQGSFTKGYLDFFETTV